MISEKIQQLFSDAAAGDVISMLALGCFMGIYLCISIFLLLELWSREGTVAKKLFWAVVVMIPVLGWLFYMAFYKLPVSKPPC